MNSVDENFPHTKSIYCDNKPALRSDTIKTMLSNVFNSSINFELQLQSTSNGLVERFHSMLADIAMILGMESDSSYTIELTLRATTKYNNSMQSVVFKRPIDIVHTASAELRQEKRNGVQKAQIIQRNRINRKNRVFVVDDTVMVKTKKSLGNKLTPLYVDEKVEANLGTTVLIGAREVHKDNVR